MRNTSKPDSRSKCWVMGNNKVTRDISTTLHEIAGLFGEPARETILSDNFEKHAFEINMILEKCRQGGRILDVGGGMGVNLLCLRRLSPALELHLIDRFEEYTDENRMGPGESGLQLMRDSAITVNTQDFWQTPVLPYETEFFDVVTCLDVLEHLPGHPLKLLGEINRVLKKGGTAIVSGPNSTTLMSRIRLLLGRYPYTPLELWCNDDYYSHYREYSRDECRTLLQMAEFGEIETVMLAEPSGRKAGYRSQASKYSWPLRATAVWLIYFVTILLPRLRPTVYCIARKPGESIS